MSQSRTLTPEQAGTAQLPVGSYRINEAFYSVQGEGVLAGTPMVFVRFAHCNLRCSAANAGFNCDTEFESGRVLTAAEVVELVADTGPPGFAGWVLLTGGEPALQLNKALIRELKAAGYMLASETNGTIKLPAGLDWVCVSPKSADHTLRQRQADEYKLVRVQGQALPLDWPVKAEHWVVSPGFAADGTVQRSDVEWCVNLVKENPQWRLSLQIHKLLGVR